MKKFEAEQQKEHPQENQVGDMHDAADGSMTLSESTAQTAEDKEDKNSSGKPQEEKQQSASSDADDDGYQEEDEQEEEEEQTSSVKQEEQEEQAPVVAKEEEQEQQPKPGVIVNSTDDDDVVIRDESDDDDDDIDDDQDSAVDLKFVPSKDDHPLSIPKDDVVPSSSSSASSTSISNNNNNNNNNTSQANVSNEDRDPHNLNLLTDEDLLAAKSSLEISKKLLDIRFGFHLDNINEKIKEYGNRKGKDNEDALKAAKQLYRGLLEEKYLLCTGPGTDEEKLGAFKSACVDKIDAADVVLKEHRGWKQLIADLFSAIISLVTLYTVNYATGRGMFGLFATRTHGKMVLDELKEDLGVEEAANAPRQ